MTDNPYAPFTREKANYAGAYVKQRHLVLTAVFMAIIPIIIFIPAGP